ncbi:MAG TPA: helical backbone metal receptor [Candidatus Acidoferrales bacterium]|nr:helical backbone metal receptor [Candidatus Acidoferrales bacterium]
MRIAIIVAMACTLAAQRAVAARFPAGRGAQASKTRIVIDEVGRRVVMPAEVNRIVTLAPNLTETVYALGLEAKLAGDTNFCDTPAAAKEKAHVGDPQNPSLEAIVALRPDLVLATTSINREETADALARLGIAVYTTDSHTVRGTLDSIAHIADAAGVPERGTALVTHLQNRLDALHSKLADLTMVHVLFVVWEEPLITVGENTFIADALRWAGAESIVLSDNNWPQLSLEEVVRLQPDYIVFTSGHQGAAKSELADLRAKPVWRDLDAVEMGHVVDVSEEALRPAPGLVDAIEQLAHELHPEAFAEENENRNAKFETRLAFAGYAGGGCDRCGR